MEFCQSRNVGSLVPAVQSQSDKPQDMTKRIQNNSINQGNTQASNLKAKITDFLNDQLVK